MLCLIEMEELRKAILQIAISLLIFWIISPILFNLIGLEFTETQFRDSYEEARFFGLPICILLTLLGTLKSTDNSIRIFFKVFLTIGTSIFAVFILIAMLWSHMCDWTNEETFYVSKNSEKVKIIKRRYGCGMVDSGPPIEEIFKVREVSEYFIIASKINVNFIDETKWRKYEK